MAAVSCQKIAVSDSNIKRSRKVTDAPGDDVERRDLWDLDLLRSQAVLLQLLRDQVPVGDLYLLLLRIPWKRADLVLQSLTWFPQCHAFVRDRRQIQWILDLE